MQPIIVEYQVERIMGSDEDELLDAYVWWNFDAGEMPGQLRVGDQVLSWGESTFIQNSINTINMIQRAMNSQAMEDTMVVGA